MYKERYDIWVIAIASILGLVMSIGGNPLTGVVVLVVIMGLWALLPHLPVIRKFIH